MGLKNEARKCNRNIKYYRHNYWLTDYKFKPWTRDCLTCIFPFWHETDSLGGSTPHILASHNTHALIYMIDPQPHPETVHQVCRLHKQWHRDYVQLKVWYKNNDDNIGGFLDEYLALCAYSAILNLNNFHWTKTCNKGFLVKMAGCQRRSLLEVAVGHLAAEFPMAASWHCDNFPLQTLIIPSKAEPSHRST